MNPDRRWLVLRTAVWIALVVYAVSIIRDQKRSDSVGAAMAEVAVIVETPVAWVAVERPGTGGASPGTGLPAPTAVALGDPTEALSTFSTLFDAECPSQGRTFRLHLTGVGLARAEANGPVAPCVAERLWGATWPAVDPPIELELGG